MQLSRKNIFLSLFWSSAGFVTGIVRTIFLVPIFLTNWDEKLYGFWLLIANFYGLSVYVIEGYSRYSINEYSKQFFKDKPTAYKYFGSGLRLLLLLTAVSCILFFVVLKFAGPAEALFHVKEDVINYYQLKHCLWIMYVLACVHSISKYIVYGIFPHGKIYVPERFIAIYVVAEAGMWLLAATSAISLSLLFLLYSVILSTLSILFVVVMVRRHRFYKLILFRGSLRGTGRSAINALSLIINNFCEKFTVEGLVFLISGFFSALMVPVYTTMRTIANFMVTGTNMVVATFTVEYQKHFVAKDGKSLLNLFNATWLLIGFIINYGLIIFNPLLPHVFTWWTKGQLIFDQLFFDSIIVTGLFIAYGSNIIIYLKSVNRLKQTLIVSFTRAAMLLVLILVFPKELRFIGYSLLITETFINMILLNAILYYELGKMQSAVVAGKIFWNAIPFIMTGLYIFTSRSIELESYLKMTIALALLTIVYILQIMKVDNEALVVRLQIIKYKLTGKRNT